LGWSPACCAARKPLSGDPTSASVIWLSHLNIAMRSTRLTAAQPDGRCYGTIVGVRDRDYRYAGVS
jgi:hypothetical protein